MHANLIPPDRREAVSRALSAVFGSDIVEDLTPVRDGLSGALVCQVTVGGRSALLRVQRETDTLRDPARQYACMATAAAAGLAPPVLFADAEAGVTLTEFIEVQPLAALPGGLPAVVVEAGRLIARLQATPVFPPLIDYFDGMERVIAATLASGMLMEKDARAPLAAYRQVCAAYPRLAPDAWVSSHNDLNPSNILCDGRRLWLVDWEASFAADPHVDPAMLANWFGLQGPGEAMFLGAVFGEVDDARRARIFLMRQVCLMFVGCMMLTVGKAMGAEPLASLEGASLGEVRQGLVSGAVQIGTPDGQIAYAKAALNAVAASVATAEFAAARVHLLSPEA